MTSNEAFPHMMKSGKFSISSFLKIVGHSLFPLQVGFQMADMKLALSQIVLYVSILGNFSPKHTVKGRPRLKQAHIAPSQVHPLAVLLGQL